MPYHPLESPKSAVILSSCLPDSHFGKPDVHYGQTLFYSDYL